MIKKENRKKESIYNAKIHPKKKEKLLYNGKMHPKKKELHNKDMHSEKKERKKDCEKEYECQGRRKQKKEEGQREKGSTG